MTERSSPWSASRIASFSSGESSCSPPPPSTFFTYSRAVSRCRMQERTTPLWAASSNASDVDWWPDSSP
jgi:hypothetical protein